VLPEPVLVGRNPEKLRALAVTHGVTRWTTDLAAALAEKNDTLYFDAQTTNLRAGALRAAIAAGKHVYCEKPSAASLREALEVYRMARTAGVKHGVVQHNLFLPGFIKLRSLIEAGFFGRIHSVVGEFGYWVFSGGQQQPQRRRGISGSRTAAASSWTCSHTGVISSTTCSEQCAR